MSNKLTFGCFEGKTYEWLLFRAPWYAEWIYNHNIHQQKHSFSEEQEQCFLELFVRASALTGTCKWCKHKPFTRMGLSYQYGSGALGNISFYCDECEYIGGSPTSYFPPSFFVEGSRMPRCEHLRIVSVIKSQHIGTGRLTQAKMEEFFHNDANFVYATPGFFAKEKVAAV